jgi:hypothetical protein
MPGKHGFDRPCGFRYIPDVGGYTCAGGHHRLNRQGEDEDGERDCRRRERQQKIMDDQDTELAADIQHRKEK